MSQSHRISSRSEEGELTFRIVGRKKRYKINKIVGETREALGRRIAEAINNHPRSLESRSVPVRESDIDYVRIMVSGKNKGPDVNEIDESHTFLSVKLTQLGHTKLSSQRMAKDGEDLTSEPQDSGTDHRRGRRRYGSPSNTNQAARRRRTGEGQGESKFQPPSLSKRARQDTVGLAISDFEKASKLIMQGIKDGRYPPEVLNGMDLIAIKIKDEIAAARSRVTRALGEEGIGDEGPRQHGAEPMEPDEPGNRMIIETGERLSGHGFDVGQVSLSLGHPSSLLAPEQTPFWKELLKFLGSDPRSAGADGHKIELLPAIYKVVTEQFGGFYNFVAEGQTSRAKLAEVIPDLDPKDAVAVYEKYLFHWERSQARTDLPKEDIMQIDPRNLMGPGIINLGLKPLEDYTDSNDVFNAPVMLLRNCKIKDEEEMIGYFQSTTLKGKRLTCKPQNPTFTGLPVQDPSSELQGGGGLMKPLDFIRGYYTEEEKAEHMPGRTFYGIGLRIEDHKLLVELDSGLKRHKLGSVSPISGVISGLTREKLNPTYRGVNIPEVLIKLDGAWTGGHTEFLGIRAANVQVHGTGESTWICVTDHQSFRAQVLDRKGYDIRKHETLWYMDLDTLLTYKVKATIVRQRSVGDLVLLGPNVMHWVRASGKAICIAWNFMLGNAEEMDLYCSNLEAAASDWGNIVPMYWYAQESVLQKMGGGTIEQGCVTLFAKRLVGYYTKEWTALLSKGNVTFANRPGPLVNYPAFCRTDSCSGEIINVHFSGYCAACSLARKNDRKASYLLTKGDILSGLKRVLGGYAPGLVELEELSRKNQGLP